MSKGSERRKIALETGEWWNIPWWKDFYDDKGTEKHNIEVCFDVLKVIFDAKWFRNQMDHVISRTKKWITENEDKIKMNDLLFSLKEELEKASKPSEAYNISGMILGYYPVHPLFNHLLAEGKPYFEYLVALGRDLLDVGEADLLGDLFQKLKNPDEFLGAYLELRTLAYLTRRGFSIQRNPPSGIGKKKSDIRVCKCSEVLFVELKSLLKPSKTNNDITGISDQIFHDITSAFTGPYILHLELSEVLRKQAKTKKGRNNLWNSRRMIVSQIKDDIAKRIANKEWGHHIIPGLAEYYLQQRQGKGSGGQGSFAGLPLLDKAEAEKMFRNSVRDAVNQLPQDKPGILIVELPFFIDSNPIRYGLSSRFRKNKHLSAVILIHNHMELVQNPDAVQDVTNYAAVKDILSLGND